MGKKLPHQQRIVLSDWMVVLKAARSLNSVEKSKNHPVITVYSIEIRIPYLKMPLHLNRALTLMYISILQMFTCQYSEMAN